MNKKCEKGFTTIELLLTLVSIVIIAAILTFVVGISVANCYFTDSAVMLAIDDRRHPLDKTEVVAIHRIDRNIFDTSEVVVDVWHPQQGMWRETWAAETNVLGNLRVTPLGRSSLIT